MAEILNIHGVRTPIYNNDDFAMFLDESLGYEVGDYFRTALKDVANEASEKYKCVGECDITERIEEHWHRIVQDIHDELVSWEIDRKTKRDLEGMRNYLVRTINAEL